MRATAYCSVAIFLLLASSSAYPETQTENKSFPSQPGDTLVIQSDFGRIRIRGGESSSIEARYEKTAPGSLQKDFEVIGQKNGSEIYFYSFFSGDSQESVNFDIQAPKSINIVIWGANPELDLQGIDGTVRVQTITGNVRLQDLNSSVVVTSSRGDISYRQGVQPHGDIRLESSVGSIRCDVSNTLNLRAWLTAGGFVGWDTDKEVSGTTVERQIGSFGPILNAVSIRGNVRVGLFIPNEPPRSSTPDPARTGEDRSYVPAAPQPPERMPDPPQPRVAETPAPPQQPAQPMPSGSSVAIRVNVASVLLNVSVWDRQTNRSMSGLQRDDFVVYENGVAQEIQQLEPAEAPFSLLLLLDVSGSTQSYVKLMREAATLFVRQIKSNDKVAVATFNSEVELLQDFTSDRSAANRAISRIRSGGGTAFYDALLTCVDQFMRGIEGRKAIVVFSDGVDNQLNGDYSQGSRTTFAQLYRRIQEVDALIYTIFLNSERDMTISRAPRSRPGRYPGSRRSPLPFPFPIPFPNPNPSPYPNPNPYPSGGDQRATYETAREHLQTIADQTGGRMYMPERAEDLSSAYSEIADDLRVQYLLGYTSSAAANDPGWRSIRVDIRDHPDAVARTRKGYYPAAAGRQQAAGSKP